MGIEIFNYNEHTKADIAIALGYFDSVHLGHCRLITECLNSRYQSAVFTFSNNPEKVLSGVGEQIYTFSERTYILDSLGVEFIIDAEFDREFSCVQGAEFIDALIDKHNVKMIVVGSDYRYGYMASNGIKELEEHCKRRHIELKIIDMLLYKDSKIASRDIKKLLSNGEIDTVNKLLPYRFFLLGRVQKGRNVGGSLLGYPTANVLYPECKVKLKSGVYSARILLGDKWYNAITNVGTHPTFEDYTYNIESYILGFNGDLYDRDIKIEFLKYMREVKKFDSVDALKRQIASDIEQL